MSEQDTKAPVTETRAATTLQIVVRSDASGQLIDGREVAPDDPRLWPAILADRLSAAGVPASVTNGSMPGLTVIELREWSRDPLWVPAATNTIVLCVGGNVGTAPAPGLLRIPAAFRAAPVRHLLARTRFRQALGRLMTRGRVVFVEPPVSRGGRLDLGTTLSAVRKQIRAVAAEFDLPVVAVPRIGRPAKLDESAHRMIGERVAEVVRAELEAGRVPDRSVPPTSDGAVVILRSDSMALGSDLGRPDLNRPELWPHVMRDELSALGVSSTVLNMSYSLHDVQLELRGYKRDRLVRQSLDEADLVLLHLGTANWYPRGRPDWMSTVMSAIRPAWLQQKAEGAYRVIRPTVMKLSRGNFRQGAPEVIRREYDELIASMKHGSRRVVLMEPFPGETPRSPLWRKNMDELAEVVRDLGRKHDVLVIDGGEPLRELPWDTLTYDGVHLNPTAHELVGRHMARVVRDRGLLS